MPVAPAVVLENVSKKFGGFTAVNDISFEVERGEIFSIIGPNGAGKTTTVNMICGMFAPGSGNIRTLGLNPVADARKLRGRLGVQFQEASLPNAIMVREALQLYSSFYEHPADWRGLAEEWGIVGKLGTRFEDLSGGQKQRLFICLALLNDPEFVVLDELTTGLDPNARRQSWELVRQIRDGGATVLLVTHFMDEAEYLSDRIALIANGGIMAMGTPGELTNQASQKRVVSFTASEFDARILHHLGQVTVHNDHITVEGSEYLMANVADLLRQQGIDPVDLQTEHSSLEDLFISLTGGSSMEAVS